MVDLVAAELASWSGVRIEAEPGGGSAIRYGDRELGVLMPDGVAEIHFTERIRAMLVETGRAAGAGPGRVTHALNSAADATAVIELLRLAFERARVAAEVASRRAAR